MTLRDLADANYKGAGWVRIPSETWEEPSFEKSFDGIELEHFPKFLLDRKVKCMSVEANEFFGFPELVIELERH